METQEIFGSVQRYLVINTTEYNNDGNYSVLLCDKEELVNFGVNPEESIKLANTDKYVTLDDLRIGDVGEPDCPGGGAYVMRIA